MIKVAFVLSNSSGWTGGLVYLRNLLSAIMLLEDRKIEPVLIVDQSVDSDRLHGFDGIKLVKTSVVSQSSSMRIVRKITNSLIGGNILLERVLRRNDIEVLSHSGPLRKNARVRTISWLPDFQHVRMPEFFSSKEVATRNFEFNRIIESSDIIVLSSEDAKNDFVAFKPSHVDRARVLHFVAGAGTLCADEPAANSILKQYGIPNEYFYLPGQFWKHKNHKLILDALALMQRQGRAPVVVSTGSTNDRRNPGYFSELQEFIKSNGISDRFLILGLIPFEHLHLIMRQSIAVINPSRFEGWSTTVEEAKSMGKAIVLSDIPVHREQAPDRAHFVDPDDASLAATILADLVMSWSDNADREAMEKAKERFLDRKKAFGETYQRIVLNLVGK